MRYNYKLYIKYIDNDVSDIDAFLRISFNRKVVHNPNVI